MKLSKFVGGLYGIKDLKGKGLVPFDFKTMFTTPSKLQKAFSKAQ